MPRYLEVYTLLSNELPNQKKNSCQDVVVSLVFLSVNAERGFWLLDDLLHFPESH